GLVLLTLALPDDREVLAASSISLSATANLPTLQELTGSLFTRIPPDLTPQEINAIKKHELFFGMRKKVVEYTFGKPEEINDYGRSGIQMVYSGGHFLVYLDATGKVIDRQILGIKPQ